MNEQQDKVEALEIVRENLKSSDREFADSLCKNFKKYGQLSCKQIYWVDVLRDRAMNKGPVAEQTQVGNFSGVYSLFKKAKEKLKFPKIFLQVEGDPIVLSMSGPKSKMPDTINVAGEGEYLYRKWYGRVQADGTWTKGMKQYEESAKVEEVLKALSRNPAKAAKEYGKLTGRCCFCHLPLSDVKSTAAGFGPTCASHYGLTAEWKAAQSVLDVVAKTEEAQVA